MDKYKSDLSEAYFKYWREKLGTDDDGVRAHFANHTKKRKKFGGGGFTNNPELAKKAGAKGRQKRWGNNEANASETKQ